MGSRDFAYPSNAVPSNAVTMPQTHVHGVGTTLDILITCEMCSLLYLAVPMEYVVALASMVFAACRCCTNEFTISLHYVPQLQRNQVNDTRGVCTRMFAMSSNQVQHLLIHAVPCHNNSVRPCALCSTAALKTKLGASLGHDEDDCK